MHQKFNFVEVLVSANIYYYTQNAQNGANFCNKNIVT